MLSSMAVAPNPWAGSFGQSKDVNVTVSESYSQPASPGSDSSDFENLSEAIGELIKCHRYNDVLSLVNYMRQIGQRPDMAMRWRWIRQLDAASGFSRQVYESGSRTADEETALIVLDAMLRLVGPSDSNTSDTNPDSILVPMKSWDFKPGTRSSISIGDEFLNDYLSADRVSHIQSQFRVVEETAGTARPRPNLSPARFHGSREDAVFLANESPKPVHMTHPVVPHLHVLKDVLSPTECVEIVATAAAVGFLPDSPLDAEGKATTTLAYDFYWVVDLTFCNKLWSRVEDFVPKTFNGRKVRGLNRFFRIYRYIPGLEYTAHLDGAWTPSSIDPETDRHVEDASPAGAKQLSVFTFLIYLNDDFEAGDTTFFLPSPRQGSMNAYPVRPRQGSVLLFPHGEIDEALFHEGTTVTKGPGCSPKYIVRSEVIYDL